MLEGTFAFLVVSGQFLIMAFREGLVVLKTPKLYTPLRWTPIMALASQGFRAAIEADPHFHFFEMIPNGMSRKVNRRGFILFPLVLHIIFHPRSHERI